MLQRYLATPRLRLRIRWAVFVADRNWTNCAGELWRSLIRCCLNRDLCDGNSTVRAIMDAVTLPEGVRPLSGYRTATI
jgi:hypothetical protein